MPGIATIRDHVEDWRRDNDWSRETVVQLMVETHEQLGLDRLTGIRFDPPTRDTYERLRVNADKVYRWLDDHSKDKNLLSANFLWSILAAMPVDRRLALVEALLSPVGITVAVDDLDDERGDELPEIKAVVLHIQAVATSSADATVSLAAMADGIDPGEAAAAKKKLTRLAAVGQQAIRLMNRLLRRTAKGVQP